MSPQELSKAKNPDLRASLAAMRRAAELARQTALQTNTAIVIVRDGKTVRVTADELRVERKLRAGLRPADVPDGANESDPLEASQRLRSSW
jgi:mRNA degradation ribonuclease J1/J2